MENSTHRSPTNKVCHSCHSPLKISHLYERLKHVRAFQHFSLSLIQATPTIPTHPTALSTLEVMSSACSNFSQAGFMRLQWPHHGAKNLMKSRFPVVISFGQTGAMHFIHFTRLRNDFPMQDELWESLKSNPCLQEGGC